MCCDINFQLLISSFYYFSKIFSDGRAIAQAVSRWFLTAAAWVWEVGFMVDKVALGQVFSEYFGFPLPIFIPQNSPSS
jgi:hypothetical protein